MAASSVRAAILRDGAPRLLWMRAEERNDRYAREHPVSRRARAAGFGGRAGRRYPLPEGDRGLCPRRGGAAAGGARWRAAAGCRARRRDPVVGWRRHARGHRRRRRQGRVDRRRRARAKPSRPTPSTAGSIMWRSARSNAVAWSAGKQAFAHTGKGAENIAGGRLDRRRACLRPEGPAVGHRTLQRRDALVSQRQGRRPIRSNGRARISVCGSVRTADSW